MSILINKDIRVITQGITGKTGQFHTRMLRATTPTAANCFVAGVNPKKPAKTSKAFPSTPA
jgi:succinyl-CoA synthetase alpha subunit